MSVGLGLVKKKKQNITVESLQKMFPKKKGSISEKTVELVNAVQNDPEFDGSKLIDTMVTFQNVMMKNSGSMDQYIDAVRFCAYVECEETAVEAYKRTFSNREFVRERWDVKTDSIPYKELVSAASRYRKSPMVVDILAQADVPLYLMFQGARYQAVQVLADEMVNANFSKDRISAADKLLTHVKPPENVQIEMDIGIQNNSAVTDLQAQLAQMAERSLELIQQGADKNEVINAPIRAKVIDVEIEGVANGDDS